MKKEIDIKDYLKILVKWRRIIVFNVLTITLLSIVISLLLPKKWTAETTILPPSEESSSMAISALLGGGFGGKLGGGAFSRMLPGMATLSDLFAKELHSRRIIREVIEKNNLLNLYKVKFLGDAIDELKEKTTIKVSPEGIITITVTEKTPELAAQIANSFVEALDRFNREVNMTVGKKNRLFLEDRLKTVKNDLKAAEESLKVFQERHKTASLPDEMSAAIDVISNLKAQIMAKEVQLGMLNEYSSKNNPEIVRLQNEIAQLKKKEREIEKTGKGKEEFGAGFSIPFSKLPEVSLELIRRKRDMSVQGELFKLLTQQYEQAKIIEVKDTPTVQVLDRATPPERRSFPKRKKLVVIAFLFSVFFSIGLCFLFEYIENIKAKNEDEEWLDMGKTLTEDISIFFRKIGLSRNKNTSTED
jgi:tyrosine-protein kinase Etk/Wzc